MNTIYKNILSITSSVLLCVFLSTSFVMAKEEGSKRIDEGKKLAFTRKKGNCLACHLMIGGVSPGNIAPPLIAMQSRYPDKKALKAQIFDASKKNSETTMPLFGRYEILTKDELDKVVDFIYSL
ncbi:MAG: sulfur oxidation c-type cytochrome SoxX [Pseudomonadota bacterium]